MFQQNTLTYLPISMYGGFYNGFNNRQSIAKLRRSAELRVSSNDMKCILNVITYVYCTRHSPLKILLQQCTMYPEYRRSVITCYGTSSSSCAIFDTAHIGNFLLTKIPHRRGGNDFSIFMFSALIEPLLLIYNVFFFLLKSRVF